MTSWALPEYQPSTSYLPNRRDEHIKHMYHSPIVEPTSPSSSWQCSAPITTPFPSSLPSLTKRSHPTYHITGNFPNTALSFALADHQPVTDTSFPSTLCREMIDEHELRTAGLVDFYSWVRCRAGHGAGPRRDRLGGLVGLRGDVVFEEGAAMYRY